MPGGALDGQGVDLGRRHREMGAGIGHGLELGQLGADQARTDGQGHEQAGQSPKKGFAHVMSPRGMGLLASLRRKR